MTSCSPRKPGLTSGSLGNLHPTKSQQAHGKLPACIPQTHSSTTQSLLGQMVPGGRTAPTRPNAGPRSTSHSSYIEAIYQSCKDVQVGDRVRARRWHARDEEYGPWAEGFVLKRCSTGVPPDELPAFTIRHVNRYTERGYNKSYRMLHADQVEPLENDYRVEHGLQERSSSVAPCMGPSRAYPSRAVSRIIVDGNLQR